MATDLFSVLSDPTRRALLIQLRAGERSVGELVEAIDVSQPTVSKHLKVLRDAGLAHTRVQGQRRFYTLSADPLQEVADYVGQLLNTEAPQAAEAAGAAADGEAAASSGTASSGIPAQDEAAAEAKSKETSGEVATTDEEEAHPKRGHGVGRTVEQVTERAQEFFDRLSKQRLGRRK